MPVATEEVEGRIGTTKRTPWSVGNDSARQSMNVTNQVHEANKSCTDKSHESVVIYIVNPHEFYIATKEEEEEAAAAWPCPGHLHP